MTTTEFSNEFDILYNNINSNQAPGLNTYEKSVFLTKAQEELVINLYNGRNQYGMSFESTEEVRRYLDTLIKTSSLDSSNLVTGLTGLSEDSKFYKLPADVLFIVAEGITYADEQGACINGFPANVYAVTQDEFAKVRNNPFRGVTKYKALRLDGGLDTDNNRLVEVIAKYDIDKYTIRYLSVPDPIIIGDIQTGEYSGLTPLLSIRGKHADMTSKLPEALHPSILQTAVNMAKAAWQATTIKS